MLSIATPDTQSSDLSTATAAPTQPLLPHDQTPPNHIFISKLPTIPIPNHLPLHTYCFQNLSQYPNKPCLIIAATGKSYTFAETHLLCRKVAAGLTAAGITKGDVIMTLLQNCAEFIFTFIAASMIGAATTTANPFCTSGEIFKQFKASQSKLIVTESRYVDKIKSFPDNCYPVVVTVDDPVNVNVNGDGNGKIVHFADFLTADDGDLPTVEIDPNDAVALPFSSGTTGLPKGVVLTHKSLITSVAQQVDGENPNLYLKPDDVVLCVLPLFHIYSLNSVLLCSMRAGAAVLVMQKFEMNSLLESIQRYRVTVAAVVPPLVLALAKNPVVDKYDLSSIRMVLSGAAPLGKELEEALLGRVPQAVFGQGYGMTEAGPVLSMSPSFAKQPLPTKSGSCGNVVRNAEMKVIDPETGCSLPRNQAGEICIHGAQIMKEYLNDPESTSTTIDVEGWLHTGDIGYVDDDDDVFIVDRVKELIKFKGFQVPPAELEGLLVSHPNIVDAAVVPQKDEEAGEVPVAFVVQSSGFELTEDAVKEFVSKQVVFYKRLHKVYFLKAIPKSPSGKILRKDLRAKLAGSSFTST